MAANPPVATTNLPQPTAFDEVLGNQTADGILKTGRLPVSRFAAQMAAQAPFSQLVGASAGGMKGYPTEALLAAETAPEAGTLARVYADPVPQKNGTWRKTGAAGQAGWEILPVLAERFIVLDNAGAGTGDAIELTSGFALPGDAYGATFQTRVRAANAGPVTIAVNGAAPRPLVTAAGNPLEANYLKPDMPLQFVDGGADYRMTSTVTDAAIQAVAEAKALEAAAWAQGTEPGGPGTKSAREHALDAAASVPPLIYGTIAALRARAGVPATLAAAVIGYHAAIDLRGGGDFYYDASDTVTADDGGMVIVDGDGRRWKRVWDGGRLPVEFFGAKISTDSADAPANSSAIQAAHDYLFNNHRGGDLWFPGGANDYPIQTPPVIHEYVNLIGAGDSVSILWKVDATPSPISDNTVPVYSGIAVGNPVCCVHFVGSGGGNWSDGRVEGIAVRGDTLSAKTSSLHFAFFFRGMSSSTVRRCRAWGAQVGFFWGAGATIGSEVTGCSAVWVGRGFYQYFSTSTTFRHNFVGRYRFAAYDISAYYSSGFDNSADFGAEPLYDASDSALRLADTEVCVSTRLYACKSFEWSNNGCEETNGTWLEMSGCQNVTLRGNAILNVFSDHDNVASGLAIYLIFTASCDDIVFDNNRFLFRPLGEGGKLIGGAVLASHYNLGGSGNSGVDFRRNNAFVETVSGTGRVEDAGWTEKNADYQQAFSALVTAALNFPSTAADGGVQGQAVAVPGCRLGDFVHPQLIAGGQGTFYSGQVTADGTVTVYHQNPLPAPYDPVLQTFNIRVERMSQ